MQWRSEGDANTLSIADRNSSALRIFEFAWCCTPLAKLLTGPDASNGRALPHPKTGVPYAISGGRWASLHDNPPLPSWALLHSPNSSQLTLLSHYSLFPTFSIISLHSNYISRHSLSTLSFVNFSFRMSHRHRNHVDVLLFSYLC